MTETVAAPYITDDAEGEGWSLKLGDSCERLAELETDSIDFSLFSPPFASLYVYSPSERDIGNNPNQEAFLSHYRYVVDELLRVVKPGRLVAVHCAQVTTQKWRDGVIGLTDFRGDLIRCHIDAGFVFHGEVVVWKNPQAQATRTKATSLLFVSLERDGTAVRPALADYVLMFRVPGDNAVPVKPEASREEWIQWASPIWPAPESDDTDILDLGPLNGAWFDIRETNTLNTAVAKESQDERHICPLQLDLIDRCIRLWTNRGETVLSPFAGIGSECYQSVLLGRQTIGIELKASYWQTAVRNLQQAEQLAHTPSLFDDDDE